MNERAIGWWRMRTLREQRLLLVMAALMAVVIVWLGIIRPVDDALSDARERHRTAVLTLADTEAAAAAVAALERNAPPRLAAPLAAIVSQSATEAGFANAAVSEQGGRRVGVSIASVRPAAFFAWIASLEARGIVVDRMSAKANGDPTLSIDATLVGRGG